jgi:hypothetical protein
MDAISITHKHPQHCIQQGTTPCKLIISKKTDSKMTVLWEKLLLYPKGFELLFENSKAFFLQIVILTVYPNFILMYALKTYPSRGE